MHLVEQRALGIVILFLLSALVIIKRLATGTIVDKPSGSPLIWFTNLFNLFFLLVVNPLAAILLIGHLADVVDPTRVSLQVSWQLTGLELAGFGLYGAGFLLMAWALIELGRNYQSGGTHPRATDTLVTAGPYRFIRHPMYLAALCIALGLACLLQSLACLAVFGLYFILINSFIRVEEEGLCRAYGEPYLKYRRTSKALLPYVY